MTDLDNLLDSTDLDHLATKADLERFKVDVLKCMVGAMTAQTALMAGLILGLIQAL